MTESILPYVLCVSFPLALSLVSAVPNRCLPWRLDAPAPITRPTEPNMTDEDEYNYYLSQHTRVQKRENAVFNEMSKHSASIGLVLFVPMLLEWHAIVVVLTVVCVGVHSRLFMTLDSARRTLALERLLWVAANARVRHFLEHETPLISLRCH
ncbi:hypothetical protein SPRG_12892 [Saprolegnia parasitica CBS 223.65]|uniref:PRA1 family protein n=1 Tax=Saprolegnia parasitica (strain CBS 223.65) TaxID=695850 RepID=A0A067C534_SAPPC|nr:hypothetical protein SPRG_12892 [Saprolegnia parasitica CBS 223.65]KDO21651.1 hypothetical protein SPRG_12892 [Saprolegnia parasitica CBS 223.65]|eukprot:XP_012207663.1 hypothetical protein SPRG_12892 [Saprolegnia parasitica CBS 223.65]